MANKDCACFQSIALFFPSSLVEIIQGYFHSGPREEFFKKHFSKFDLNLRLNKHIATIEELKGGLILGTSKYHLTLTAFLVQILDKEDSQKNVSRWLMINYVVGNKRYDFGKCLTANIPLSVGRIPVATNTYRLFYIKLMDTFDPSNRKILQQEFVTTTGIAPIQSDFDRVCDYVWTKISEWNSQINFEKEIHR